MNLKSLSRKMVNFNNKDSRLTSKRYKSRETFRLNCLQGITNLSQTLLTETLLLLPSETETNWIRRRTSWRTFQTSSLHLKFSLALSPSKASWTLSTTVSVQSTLLLRLLIKIPMSSKVSRTTLSTLDKTYSLSRLRSKTSPLVSTRCRISSSCKGRVRLSRCRHTRTTTTTTCCSMGPKCLITSVFSHKGWRLPHRKHR